jgi:transposase
VGLDLGDRANWYCVLDESGTIALEQRLSTTTRAMKEVFSGMPRSPIALETGMHSPWASRLLSECGHEVIVAHARNMRLIGELAQLIVHGTFYASNTSIPGIWIVKH